MKTSEYNKLALTDHAPEKKHAINWADALVIDRNQTDPPDGSRRRSKAAWKDEP